MNRILTFTSVFIGLSAAVSVAANRPESSAASYAVQVVPFQVGEGVEFPREYLDAITNDLVAELRRAKLFRQILPPDQSTEGNTPLFQLTGTVIKFRKGNRAVRAVGGLAAAFAGRTQINARVRFVDAATQQVRLERDVVGVMAGTWIGGGKSVKATKELAKQVAKAAKKEL